MHNKDRFNELVQGIIKTLLEAEQKKYCIMSN
jgi:hypothetical protein